MDIEQVLANLETLATQHYDGYLTTDELKQAVLLDIVQYTNDNFVYTGDIPVVA